MSIGKKNDLPEWAQRERDIAYLGCIVCKLEGYGYSPAELHHVRKWGGLRENAPILPLCPTHHRLGPIGVAVHAGKKKWRWNPDVLLAEVERLLEPAATE